MCCVLCVVCCVLCVVLCVVGCVLCCVLCVVCCGLCVVGCELLLVDQEAKGAQLPEQELVWCTHVSGMPKQGYFRNAMFQ